MANGIANKKGKSPADQYDKTIICVAEIAKTNKRELAGDKSKIVKGVKEQLQQNGGYITIKLSDKPLQIEQKGQDRD